MMKYLIIAIALIIIHLYQYKKDKKHIFNYNVESDITKHLIDIAILIIWPISFLMMSIYNMYHRKGDRIYDMILLIMIILALILFSK